MSEKIIDTAAQTAAPKTAKKKPAAPKKVADTGGFCVYLGPTMMGVIQRGTIYRGGRKEVLDSLAPVIEQHPLIASLVVSVQIRHQLYMMRLLLRKREGQMYFWAIQPEDFTIRRT